MTTLTYGSLYERCLPPVLCGRSGLMRRTVSKIGESLSSDELSDLLHAVSVERDRGAFARLFSHFAPRLKAFGLRQGADLAAAEELVQETMLTVWRKAATFDRSMASPTTWIFTIVRNKRIDLFRRENRAEVAADEDLDAPSDDTPADELYGMVRSGEAIQQALTMLPEDQLAVLKKAFFEDKSHSVIATEMQLPLGTVKSRIRLALARLRAHLPEERP